MTSKATKRIRLNSQRTERFLRRKLCKGQWCPAACLKLLVDLPGLHDFLHELLEGAGNSLVGGPRALVFFAPDHLIQLTLCPRLDALRRAIVNSCRSSRGPCTTLGDGRHDEAPGCGRIEWSESEFGVEVGVVTGPRSVCAVMGAGTLGWGSRSTRALLNTPPGRGSCSVPGPGTSRRSSRGGDSSGMYQVEDVSRGRVLVRGGVCDRSDVMRSVIMRGRSPCLELRGGLGAIRGSDSEFRSTARAKFKVSKDVEIWEARTLSTAIRLFTNSGDSHMASVSNARTIQAQSICETPQPEQNQVHPCCIKELSIFYLVPSFSGRVLVRRGDMLA